MVIKFLRFEDLKPRKGIPFTRQHITRLQENPDEADRFPLYVEVGENTRLLIETEVDAWLERRIANRGARLAARLAKREANRRAVITAKANADAMYAAKAEKQTAEAPPAPARKHTQDMGKGATEKVA